MDGTSCGQSAGTADGVERTDNRSRLEQGSRGMLHGVEARDTEAYNVQISNAYDRPSKATIARQTKSCHQKLSRNNDAASKCSKHRLAQAEWDERAVGRHDRVLRYTAVYGIGSQYTGEYVPYTESAVSPGSINGVTQSN